MRELARYMRLCALSVVTGDKERLGGSNMRLRLQGENVTLITLFTKLKASNQFTKIHKKNQLASEMWHWSEYHTLLCGQA